MELRSMMSDYLSGLPLQQRLLLERQAISKTQYGQKRIIEAIEEDGQIKFQIRYRDPSRVTGQGRVVREIVSSFEEAVDKVSSFGISELADLNFPDQLEPGVFRGYAQVVREISERTSGNVSAQLVLHKAQQGSDSVKDFLQKMVSTGTGIVFPTKEGAIAANYFVDGKALSTMEALQMLQKADRGLFDADELEKALKGGDEGLTKLFQKLPKRLKGIMSPREVSLSGNLLDAFLVGTRSAGFDQVARMQQLASQTLNVDSVFEVMSYAFEENANRLAGATGKQADVMRYIRMGRDRDEQLKFVRSVLQDVSQAEGLNNITDLESKLKGFINEIANSGQVDAETGDYGIEIAKKKLKQSNLFDEQEKKIIGKTFDEIEKGYDGSGLININKLKNLRSHLHNEISSLTGSMERNDIIKRIEYERMLKQVNQDISQGTVRGNVQIGGKNYGYKLAGAAVEFADELAQYGLIVPISGLKPEAAMGGATAILNFSGLAESSTRVYSDPMLTAFHGGIFGRPEELQMIAKQREEVLREFRGVIENGRLNEDSKILRAVQKIADQDIDDIMGLPEEQQFSKMINRDWARKLIQFHQSGTSINQSPEFLNLVHKYYMTELATYRKGMTLPVLPDVYRFAIDSEANAMTGAKYGEHILGIDPLNIKFDELGDVDASGKPVGKTMQITKTRIKDHKILFHENDVRKFYEALGGFDLDDKGLPILGTYMSNGEKKFGMAIARQPTGTGELIGLTRFEDIDSYREIFGGNNLFMRTLDDMRAASGSEQIMEDLYQALKGNASPIVNMNEIEKAAINVWETMYGGQARRFDRQYFEYLDRLKNLAGQTSTDKLSASILSEMYGKDAEMASIFFRRMSANIATMEMGPEIIEALRGQLPAADIRRLEAALPRKNVAQVLHQMLPTHGETIDIAMQQVFLNKSNQLTQEAGNILGVYINRSTVMAQGMFELEQAIGGQGSQIEAALKKAGISNIAILPQETPIDMTQTLTRGRFMLADLVNLAESDAATGLAAIKQLYGDQYMNLEQFQSKSLRQFGEVFGFVSQQNLQSSAVIDELLFSSGKLKGRDITTVAEGISAGVRKAGNQELANELDLAIQRGSEQAEQMLRVRGFIGQAAMSKLEQEARKSLAMADAEAKMGIAKAISEKDRLAALVSEDAMTAAETILDKNKKLIDTMSDISSQLSVSQEKDKLAYNLERLKTQIGDNILSDIEDIQRSMGISGYDLINALEYSGSERGIRLGELAKIPDLSMVDDVGTDQRAFALHRYFDIASKRREFERTTQNVELKNLIQGMNFGQGVEQKTVARMTDELIPGVRGNVISQSVFDQAAEDITVQEKQIADAVRAKRAYDIAAEGDAAAASFVNGSTTSGKILSSVDDIADDTPQIVSDILRQMSQPRSKAAQTPYQRISKQYLQEQLSKPSVRNIAIGAGLLIAGSFAYQASKDRSPESVQGPPLLPGGNAYESDYPSRNANIGAFRGQGYSPGVNYKVSLYGDRDQIERFTSSASGLTNGNISSTMYNRIPSVTNDPYQMMGRSF